MSPRNFLQAERGLTGGAAGGLGSGWYGLSVSTRATTQAAATRRTETLAAEAHQGVREQAVGDTFD
jgi:hypothetical protein